MAVFSVNQVRHLYVANSIGSTAAKGGIEKVEIGDHFCFKYNGADGLVRTDLIDRNNLLSVKYVPATEISMKHEALAYDVTILENPIVGQDYILKIYLRNGMGISPDNEYYKNAAVHATTSKTPTKSAFYVQLVKSLVMNFKREASPILNFYLLKGSTQVPVFIDGEEKTFNVDDTGYTGVRLIEARQDWALGTMSETFVDFEVKCSTITVDSDEVSWGDVSKVSHSNVFWNNGRKIADLEYFCMGDRGDHYRNMGWPNVIRTEYMVDPTKEYNVLDIHYAYVGANESVQKSEKTLTVVSQNDLSDLVESILTPTDTPTEES